MKQKLLLLGASMVLLGTVAFGGALSFPEFTDNDSTTTVNVFDPAGPTIALGDEVTNIAADGLYHEISSINATDADANYDYTLTDIELDYTTGGPGPVTVTPTCGAWDFSLVSGSDDDALNGLSVAVDEAGSPVDIGSVYLMIPPVGTNEDCALSGAVVTATFIVEGDTPGGS
jgi:plastocyanin